MKPSIADIYWSLLYAPGTGQSALLAVPFITHHKSVFKSRKCFRRTIRCQSFYVLPCLRSPVSYIQLYNGLVAVLTLHHCRRDCAAPPGWSAPGKRRSRLWPLSVFLTCYSYVTRWPSSYIGLDPHSALKTRGAWILLLVNQEELPTNLGFWLLLKNLQIIRSEPRVIVVWWAQGHHSP